MKRSTHPEAYDYFIKMGDTPQQIAGYIEEFVIGVWEAHADLRAAGKLPAIMLESTEADESYDPSVITDEELEMFREAVESINDDLMSTPIND